MDPPGIIYFTSLTASSNAATVTVESARATSMTAECTKSKGGASWAIVNVTMYPGSAGRAVVDISNLEPKTRYDLQVSASNAASSTPFSKLVFSTRSAPKE